MSSPLQPKIFLILLGCKPPGRNTEQHDIFVGMGNELRDLVSSMKTFWPEPEQIHIDAWREIQRVDDFDIIIKPKGPGDSPDLSQNKDNQNKLFLINLGGYQENKFEEQHYIVLTVQKNRAEAIKKAKESLFFKINHYHGAASHIDDKYGIDVDDFYDIEELLSPGDKEKYTLEFIPSKTGVEDEFHLGYLKISELAKN